LRDDSNTLQAGSPFELNYRILSERFPLLARMVDAVPTGVVGSAQAQDGGVCYAVQVRPGEWSAITDPVEPIGKAQRGIDRMIHRLGQGFNPAVVAGLRPGYVLDTVYRHFESRLAVHEPFRHIYVVVDSIHCLIGWMTVADRSAILARPEIEFYWHESLGDLVRLIEQDEQRSHLFIPVSELSEPEINRLIVPLAELYLKRERELERWKRENDEYYDAMSDESLASVIAGNAGRKPRLLMPTHASSTVIQFSTRDTSEAFGAIGWETRIIRAERDLSPWLVAKTIREFRPDLLLFINHLRTEVPDLSIYPQNLMFVTWIQDAMTEINNREMAEKWVEMATGNPDPEKA
jgi:hypothetical protein